VVVGWANQPYPYYPAKKLPALRALAEAGDPAAVVPLVDEVLRLLPEPLSRERVFAMAEAYQALEKLARKGLEKCPESALRAFGQLPDEIKNHYKVRCDIGWTPETGEYDVWDEAGEDIPSWGLKEDARKELRRRARK
jgi:hypothetical protein